jgi:hypothetical protein
VDEKEIAELRKLIQAELRYWKELSLEQKIRALGKEAKGDKRVPKLEPPKEVKDQDNDDVEYLYGEQVLRWLANIVCTSENRKVVHQGLNATTVLQVVLGLASGLNIQRAQDVPPWMIIAGVVVARIGLNQFCGKYWQQPKTLKPAKQPELIATAQTKKGRGAKTPLVTAQSSEDPPNSVEPS